MNDVEETPHRGGGMTLVQVGERAKLALESGLRCEGEIRALRLEVHTAIRPIRREWYERAAAPVIAVALVALAYAALRPVELRIPTPSAFSSGSRE